MNPAIVKALADDDKQRYDFLKACLLKLGLRVNMDDQDVPLLSPIHFSSIEPFAISEIYGELQQESYVENNEHFLKGGQDKFHLALPDTTWSMKDMAQALTDGTNDSTGDENDRIIDHDKMMKQIIAHEGILPSSQEAPYFNHQTYFDSLAAYTANKTTHDQQVGQHLLYGAVVTSTSTLLEKYVKASILVSL